MRQFLNDTYNNPLTLADIGIDNHQDNRFTAVMTKVWTDARATAVRQQMCDSAIRQFSVMPPQALCSEEGDPST